MFHCEPKLTFWRRIRTATAFLFSVSLFYSAHAAPAENTPLPAQKHSYWTVAYTSWLEFVDIDSGSFSDRAHGSFAALNVSRSLEKYSAGPWGSIGEFGLLTGQASAGGTQTVLVSYKTTRKSFYGAQASLRLAYRQSPRVVLSLGPTAIFRYIKFPDEGTGYTITSGSDINIGAILEARFRVTEKLFVQQSFGSLAFKASTLWSMGLGYSF